jgi:hypothetical protein
MNFADESFWQHESIVFVSPFVSPGCLKMGKLLITRDDGND